jgi:hypothetical protein
LDATLATRLSVPFVLEVAFFADEPRLAVLRPARALVLALRDVARPPRFFFALRVCAFVAEAERRLAAFRLPPFFFDPLLRAAM